LGEAVRQEAGALAMATAKRILVAGAGGTPSLNFIRSLRKAKERFFLIGICSNKYDLCKAKQCVDKYYLVPSARDRSYLAVLQSIIKKTRPQFLHAQNDEEVYVISKHRDELGTATFLPAHETIEICQDKFESARIWKAHGLTVPKTYRINDRNDLKQAFRKIKGKVWIRATSGAFGKWSLPTNDVRFAEYWIDYYKGWGQFSAAEYLSPRSVTWLSLWKDGELIVAQGRERLYWEFSNRSVSGVTGITGTGVTVADKRLDSLALKAIYAIDKKPNGIFGVDLTFDRNGVANPTEINIGRFFTTHEFFTAAGLNMPLLYVKLAFHQKVPALRRKINPLPVKLAWVRGMDVEPVLTTVREIEKEEDILRATLRKVAREIKR
jgi:hypothetical protein